MIVVMVKVKGMEDYLIIDLWDMARLLHISDGLHFLNIKLIMKRTLPTVVIGDVIYGY